MKFLKSNTLYTQEKEITEKAYNNTMNSIKS